MYCQKCGTQLDDDAQFCKSCGADTDGKPAAVTAAPPRHTNSLAVFGFILTIFPIIHVPRI